MAGGIPQSTAQVGDLRLEEMHLVHELVGVATPTALNAFGR